MGGADDDGTRLYRKVLDGSIENKLAKQRLCSLDKNTYRMMTSFLKTLMESPAFSIDSGLLNPDHEARAEVAFKLHAEDYFRLIHKKLYPGLTPDALRTGAISHEEGISRFALLLVLDVVEGSVPKCRLLGSPSRPYVEVSSCPSTSMSDDYPSIDGALSTRWRIDEVGAWTVGSKGFRFHRKDDEAESDKEGFADDEESGSDDGGDASETGEDTDPDNTLECLEMSDS